MYHRAHRYWGKYCLHPFPVSGVEDRAWFEITHILKASSVPGKTAQILDHHSRTTDMMLRRQIHSHESATHKLRVVSRINPLARENDLLPVSRLNARFHANSRWKATHTLPEMFRLVKKIRHSSIPRTSCQKAIFTNAPFVKSMVNGFHGCLKMTHPLQAKFYIKNHRWRSLNMTHQLQAKFCIKITDGGGITLTHCELISCDCTKNAVRKITHGDLHIKQAPCQAYDDNATHIGGER
jgi:hypothetical protein